MCCKALLYVIDVNNQRTMRRLYIFVYVIILPELGLGQDFITFIFSTIPIALLFLLFFISRKSQHNERLEFLGDALLDYLARSAKKWIFIMLILFSLDDLSNLSRFVSLYLIGIVFETLLYEVLNLVDKISWIWRLVIFPVQNLLTWLLVPNCWCYYFKSFLF